MRYFILLILCVVPAFVWSQTKNQPGIVRTQTTRYGEKGKPIEKVLIQADQVATTSDQNGEFLLPVTANIENTFIYSQIEKKGYELIIPTKLHEKIGYNPNVKIEIVMANLDEQYKYRREIEQNIRKTKEAEIAAKEQHIVAVQSEIEQLKKANKSVREQNEKLEQMQAEFQQFKEAYYTSDELIRKEAERLSRVDYQSIDSVQAVIIDLLKQGRGEEVVIKSKSLISPELWKLMMEDPGAITSDINKKTKLRDHAATQLKNIADGYASDFKNDSAAFYLRKRVELDVDNYVYTLECARFVGEFLADYDEALRLYNKCLAISIKQYGESSEEMAAIYNSIGGVYASLGDYPQALNFHQKGLKVTRKSSDIESRNTAASYNNIGNVYSSMEDYPQALDFYQKALTIWEKVLGTEHPDLAIVYNNIGVIYASQGDYPQALDYYQKALMIWVNKFGTEHPNAADSYNNIGNAYASTGDYIQAVEYSRKSLVIRKKLFGREHPDVAESYNSIGVIYASQGDYPQALDYYKKALTIREKVFATGHPDLATLYKNIGNVYSNQNDYTKALDFYRKALMTFEKTFGNNYEKNTTKLIIGLIEQMIEDEK